MKNKIEVHLEKFIKIERNREFPFKLALLELIDNSLDANADLINISEVDSDLIVSDNGDGFDDLSTALNIGASSKTGEKIGRYGIGMKDACVKYSRATTIQSKGLQIQAFWDEIMNGEMAGEFDILESDHKDGTRIILSDFRELYNRSIPTQDLCKIYDPKIRNKEVKLNVNGQHLKPLNKPEFTDTIDVTFKFGSKKVRLSGGLFKDSDKNGSIWKGYNFYYGGRLIEGNETSKGNGGEACDNYSFCVDLIDGKSKKSKWGLATNKNAFDDMRDLLAICYQNHTIGLLQKGEKESHATSMQEAIDTIQDQINMKDNMRRTPSEKPKPEKPKPSGSPGPKKKRTSTGDGTGGKYENNNPCLSSAIKYAVGHLGDSSMARTTEIGKNKLLIKVNLDNDFVMENKSNVDVMVGLVMSQYGIYKSLKSATIDISGMLDSVNEIAGEELQKRMDKKK